MIPVAADAEALQLLALDVDPMLGVGAAFGAEFLDRNLVLVQLLLAILLLDLPLDGQAVAVPAGDIGRSEEHTSELQSLMRISYAVFCLKKKKTQISK